MTEALQSDAERDTAERERVAEANAQSLSRLKALYGITLPYATADSWRPTRPSSGNIPGFERSFTILCTDGIVAWFIDPFDVLFYGHVQHFTGKVEPLHSAQKKSSGGTAKPGQEKAKRKASTSRAPKVSLSLALEALKNLAENAPR
jgi:hypothetical protein